MAVPTGTVAVAGGLTTTTAELPTATEELYSAGTLWMYQRDWWAVERSGTSPNYTYQWGKVDGGALTPEQVRGVILAWYLTLQIDAAKVSTGSLPEAVIPSTIARDTEIDPLVGSVPPPKLQSDNVTLRFTTRSGTNIDVDLSPLAPAGGVTEAKVKELIAAAELDAAKITSGLLDDARLKTDITRDSELDEFIQNVTISGNTLSFHQKDGAQIDVEIPSTGGGGTATSSRTELWAISTVARAAATGTFSWSINSGAPISLESGNATRVLLPTTIPASFDGLWVVGRKNSTDYQYVSLPLAPTAAAGVKVGIDGSLYATVKIVQIAGSSSLQLTIELDQAIPAGSDLYELRIYGRRLSGVKGDKGDAGTSITDDRVKQLIAGAEFSATQVTSGTLADARLSDNIATDEEIKLLFKNAVLRGNTLVFTKYDDTTLDVDLSSIAGGGGGGGLTVVSQSTTYNVAQTKALDGKILLVAGGTASIKLSFQTQAASERATFKIINGLEGTGQVEVRIGTGGAGTDYYLSHPGNEALVAITDDRATSKFNPTAAATHITDLVKVPITPTKVLDDQYVHTVDLEANWDAWSGRKVMFQPVDDLASANLLLTFKALTEYGQPWDPATGFHRSTFPLGSTSNFFVGDPATSGNSLAYDDSAASANRQDLKIGLPFVAADSTNPNLPIAAYIASVRVAASDGRVTIQLAPDATGTAGSTTGPGFTDTMIADGYLDLIVSPGTATERVFAIKLSDLKDTSEPYSGVPSNADELKATYAQVWEDAGDDQTTAQALPVTMRLRLETEQEPQRTGERFSYEIDAARCTVQFEGMDLRWFSGSGQDRFSAALNSSGSANTVIVEDAQLPSELHFHPHTFIDGFHEARWQLFTSERSAESIEKAVETVSDPADDYALATARMGLGDTGRFVRWWPEYANPSGATVITPTIPWPRNANANIQWDAEDHKPRIVMPSGGELDFMALLHRAGLNPEGSPRHVLIHIGPTVSSDLTEAATGSMVSYLADRRTGRSKIPFSLGLINDRAGTLPLGGLRTPITPASVGDAYIFNNLIQCVVPSGEISTSDRFLKASPDVIAMDGRPVIQLINKTPGGRYTNRLEWQFLDTDGNRQQFNVTQISGQQTLGASDTFNRCVYRLSIVATEDATIGAKVPSDEAPLVVLDSFDHPANASKYRGPWTTDQAYTVGDTVIHGTPKRFYCASSDISGSTTGPDLDSAHWEVQDNWFGTFSSAAYYPAGAMVLDGTSVYIAIADNAPNATAPGRTGAKWERLNSNTSAHVTFLGSDHQQEWGDAWSYDDEFVIMDVSGADRDIEVYLPSYNSGPGGNGTRIYMTAILGSRGLELKDRTGSTSYVVAKDRTWYTLDYQNGWSVTKFQPDDDLESVARIRYGVIGSTNSLSPRPSWDLATLATGYTRSTAGSGTRGRGETVNGYWLFPPRNPSSDTMIGWVMKTFRIPTLASDDPGTLVSKAFIPLGGSVSENQNVTYVPITLTDAAGKIAQNYMEVHEVSGTAREAQFMRFTPAHNGFGVLDSTFAQSYFITHLYEVHGHTR